MELENALRLVVSDIMAVSLSGRSSRPNFRASGKLMCLHGRRLLLEGSEGTLLLFQE